MKHTTGIIFIAFAFMLNACGQSSTKTKSVDTSEYINIVGTKVSFPHSSFTESENLVGLANDRDAMILVSEFPNNSFEQQASELDESLIERRGGEILDKKKYVLGGYEALKWVIKSPDSLIISMVLFGDEEFCTSLTAKHFLNDEESEKEIAYLLEHVVYDKDLTVDPFALSPFSLVGTYKGFKHFAKSQNTHLYTRDGKERKNLKKDPSFAIAYGKLKNQAEFEQSFKYLTSLDDVAEYKIQREGRTAYEGVFDLEDGSKRYFLLLEKDMKYIMVRGTAREDYEKTVADFKKFAKQIKWKE